MRSCVLACLAVLVAGCGSQGPATHPVHGKVTFADGSPLQRGTVEFRAVTKDGKPTIASGVVDREGAFELFTTGNKKGAAAGTYMVIVFPKRPAPEAIPSKIPPRPAVNPRFSSYETSGLEVTIVAGENEVDLRVER